MPTSRRSSIVWFLWLGTIFSVAYVQSPLYTSNQNTYLLRGLAEGGLGHLADDWVANTTDPFPVFSLLIHTTYTCLSEVLFYVYYALILGVFIYSTMGIVSIAWEIDRSSRAYRLSFVVVAGMSSGAFQWLTSKATGVDMRAFFQDGVAEQYILGSVFQPSTFGVFLLLSIYVFLRKKPLIAVLWLGVAATVHASYLLSAASLVLSYMSALVLHDKNYREALYTGLLGVIIVIPVVLYTYASFAPTSPESLDHAQSILIDYRIPHHAVVSNWIDSRASFKIALIVLTLCVLRKQRGLRLVLGIPFALSASLTLIQVSTESKFMALLFPWRISSFLMPLAAAILVAGAVSFFMQKHNDKVEEFRKSIDWSCMTILGLLFLSGVVGFHLKQRHLIEEDYIPMMNFVDATKSKSDLYLIPIWMDRFRLRTGAAILVDYKTHPYRDIEVIDWHARVKDASQFYEGAAESRCHHLREIVSRYGVTHVVTEEQLEDCTALRRTYQDGHFRVFTTGGPADSTPKEGVL